MRLALVGDIHGQWGARDVAWFDASAYDGVLFTGDLPGRTHADLLDIAREIGRLGKPAVLIPGNHDGPTPLDILREALWRGISERGGQRMRAKVEALERALGPVALGGYSLHRMGEGAQAVDIVVARPHAMDGRKLTFRPYLRDRFGIESLEASVGLLVEVLDRAERPVVLLAHNGPVGFGNGREAPWGLHGFGRDNGDIDLARAVAHAENRGQLVAVVTGHMHWNGRKPRVWQHRRRGVLYVNAARVPRVSRGVRRHVGLAIDYGVASAELVEVG